MFNKLFFLLLWNFQNIGSMEVYTPDYYNENYSNQNKDENLTWQIKEYKKNSLRRFKKVNFLSDVMNKFILNISLSLLSSIFINWKYENYFKGFNQNKSQVLMPLLGACILFFCINIFFIVSVNYNSIFFSGLFFYIKSICFGLILSFLCVYTPKENINLALISAIVAFGFSFIIGSMFKKDLTDFTILALTFGSLLGIILLISLGVKLITNNNHNINKYFSNMSMGFSVISILMSMVMISYFVNNMELNYKNLFIDKRLFQDIEYFECKKYMYADELVRNFTNIFLEILSLINENKKQKYN
jgi:FtsH-binding integral membrane protein